MLGALEILPLATPADAAYGTLRARLERAGTLLGAHDMLIAAQALTMGCVVVSDNERDFARVHGLARENWLRQP